MVEKNLEYLLKKEEVLLIWEKLAAGTKPLTKARRLEIIDKLRKESTRKVLILTTGSMLKTTSY